MKLKKQHEILAVRCIMTNYNNHFLETKELGNETDVVAVFHHQGTEKEAFELPLAPFRILAQNEVCTKYSLVACKWLQNLTGVGSVKFGAPQSYLDI